MKMLFLMSLLLVRVPGSLQAQTLAPKLHPAFQKFVGQKAGLAKKIEEKLELKAPPGVWDFFDSVSRADWVGASNRFYVLWESRYQTRKLPAPLWGPIHEVFGTYEQFRTWQDRLLEKFGNEILASMPPGSVYFGGSDAGRFIVSALSKSHTEGDPVFTLTQNALADFSYLEYVREMYGKNLNLPELDAYQKAFQDYIADVQARGAKNELRRGEKLPQATNGAYQLTGEASVMAFSEVLVLHIMEKNQGKQFFIEESYPLEGLYSRVVPHGLIMKIAKGPQEKLSSEVLSQDEAFWAATTQGLLGKVVNEGTPVAKLCTWARKVHSQKSMIDFSGDREFLEDRQAPQYFSQCRAAIAGIFEWRIAHNSSGSEKALFVRKADFAYRQAFALSPYHPGVASRYVEFLMNQNRTSDAKAIVETTLALDPEHRMEIDSSLLKESLSSLKDRKRELEKQ